MTGKSLGPKEAAQRALREAPLVARHPSFERDSILPPVKMAAPPVKRADPVPKIDKQAEPVPAPAKVCQTCYGHGHVTGGERGETFEACPACRLGIDVRSIREQTGLSQPKFAAAFRFEVCTIRDWEQGRRVPAGPARTLLILIARIPDVVREALAA